MTILHNIKHWLQTKIYHACMNIKEEREAKKKRQMLSAIDCNHDKVYFGKIAQFLGGQYMHVGDGTGFGDGVYLTA